jgi:hypothetical protein
MSAKFLHENFDFRECEPGPTGHLHEHVRGVSQHPATIHQRILERLRERVVCAVV